MLRAALLRRHTVVIARKQRGRCFEKVDPRRCVCIRFTYPRLEELVQESPSCPEHLIRDPDHGIRGQEHSESNFARSGLNYARGQRRRIIDACDRGRLGCGTEFCLPLWASAALLLREHGAGLRFIGHHGGQRLLRCPAVA